MAWEGERVVEIKCGASAYREAARFRLVPRAYEAQLPHILAVTGLPVIDFWGYWPNCNPVHLCVLGDEAYIKRLQAMERQFWMRIKGR